MTTITELHVNGTKHRVEAEPARSLLSVLREDLEIGPGQIFWPDMQKKRRRASDFQSPIPPAFSNLNSYSLGP